MPKKPTAMTEREREFAALAALREKMRNDPAYAAALLKRAGILGEDGQLVPHLKQQ